MARAIAALLLIAGSAPAMADWEYARWGQTPKEVLASANGRATPVKAKKGERVLDLDYLAKAQADWNGVPVDVRFHFTRKNPVLKAIRISPRAIGDCSKMEQAAVQKFGPGKRTSPLSEIAELRPVLLKDVNINWEDRAAGNRMSFTELATAPSKLHFCHLLFEPI